MRPKHAAAAALIAALLAAVWLLRPGAPVAVSLAPGESVHETSLLLQEKGVVPSALVFRAAAKLSGADRRIKPGAYQLRQNMFLPSLLRQLEAGGNSDVRVVIPEGFSARQIAQRLEAQGVCKADDFLRFVRAGKLEGYLFPTTYFFAPDTPADKAALRMRDEFDRRVAPEFQSAQDKPKLTLHQVVTLASIVEREAEKPEERPMIAAVYLNRMRVRMRLEADPTVQYAVGYWKKGLTRSDLQNPSPYNTYVHYGLPPGPICSPGMASIEAVLHPAQTGALYFVADATGGHVFSSTLAEHTKAKWRLKHILRLQKQEEQRKEREERVKGEQNGAVRP